jgi:hypothetical protein
MGRQLPQWDPPFGLPARLERFEKLVERDFQRRRVRLAIEDGWSRP